MNHNNGYEPDSDTLEDFKLIEKFNKGNDESFGLLVEKHKDKVRNLIFVTLNDNEYMDDIFQEVFISIYKNIKDFRFESKFTTWLYKITINKCRDYLRKKKVRSVHIPFTESENELITTGRQPDNIDLKEYVRKAIDKLPEKLRIPLIKRDIDGFSYQEIADMLDCEIGTVKSRIFRARENLKIFLSPYYKDLI